MTVIPLDTSRFRRDRSRPPSPPLATSVTGTYRSPSGGVLRFHGSYRLERLLPQDGQAWQDGQACAAGVFSGRVAHASGAGAGMASRRQTVEVHVAPGGAGRHVRVGPVDVDLLGLRVTVQAFTVAVPEAPHRRLHQARSGAGPAVLLGRCSP